MDRTISISAEMSTFSGAKEVQNFNLKVRSGPEGSRGLDYDYNAENSHKNHLWYVSRVISADLYAKFYIKITTMAVNRILGNRMKSQFLKIDFIW